MRFCLHLASWKVEITWPFVFREMPPGTGKTSGKLSQGFQKAHVNTDNLVLIRDKIMNKQVRDIEVL